MGFGSLLRGIRGRLFFSSLLPVIGFIALGVVAATSLNSISYMLKDAYVNVIPNLKAMEEVEGSRARIGQYLWGSLANKDFPKARESYIEKARVAVKEFQEAIKDYESASFQPGEEAIYASIKAVTPEYLKEVNEFIEVLAKGDPAETTKMREEMYEGVYLKNSVLIKKTAGEIVALYSKLAVENNIAQERETVRAFQFVVGIGSLCGLCVFLILLYIGNSLSKKVTGIVLRLAESGQQVTLAISQLSEAGQSLSQSSTTAAASLEETVASLEEMTSMVKMSSENATQAASLSLASRTTAEEGEREIKNLVESMQGISEASKKIEEIINVIDDIAFQTNLLALNAAVEAARAGEQGKGFAVVAEAVRSLAQKSADAAKDISHLISESVEKIEEGAKIADNSGTVLNKIVSSIKKVSDLNDEISTAGTEQTTGIQQINQAMNQLDQSSQSNAASSEEIASTANEISAQSQQMQEVVSDLSAFVTGTKAA